LASEPVEPHNFATAMLAEPVADFRV